MQCGTGEVFVPCVVITGRNYRWAHARGLSLIIHQIHSTKYLVFCLRDENTNFTITLVFLCVLSSCSPNRC